MIENNISKVAAEKLYCLKKMLMLNLHIYSTCVISWLRCTHAKREENDFHCRSLLFMVIRLIRSSVDLQWRADMSYLCNNQPFAENCMLKTGLKKQMSYALLNQHEVHFQLTSHKQKGKFSILLKRHAATLEKFPY